MQILGLPPAPEPLPMQFPALKDSSLTAAALTEATRSWSNQSAHLDSILSASHHTVIETIARLLSEDLRLARKLDATP